MRNDLFLLLDQHADARRLMRHLGLVERTLRKQGWAAVAALPPSVIGKALGQLESLVRDWSSPGLAEARSRLAVLVKTLPADAEAIGEDDLDPLDLLGIGLVTSHDAELDDYHHAAFDEMERSWAGRMPVSKSGGEA